MGFTASDLPSTAFSGATIVKAIKGEKMVHACTHKDVHVNGWDSVLRLHCTGVHQRRNAWINRNV